MLQSSTANHPVKETSESLAYQEGWRDGRFHTDLLSDDRTVLDRITYRRGYRDGLKARRMLYTGILTPKEISSP